MLDHSSSANTIKFLFASADRLLEIDLSLILNNSLLTLGKILITNSRNYSLIDSKMIYTEIIKTKAKRIQAKSYTGSFFPTKE